jgi:hypothetical protein
MNQALIGRCTNTEMSPLESSIARRRDTILRRNAGDPICRRRAVGALFGRSSRDFGELFPTRIRYTGLSTAYGFSVTIFGGFAPFISAFLVRTTGSPISPAFYVMAAGLVTGIAAIFMTDRSQEHLA